MGLLIISGVFLLKTSWFLGLLASANEKLDDRRTMRRYTVAILIAGAALRFAYVLLNGFSIPPSEAILEAERLRRQG